MARDKKPYSAKQIRDIGESMKLVSGRVLLFAQQLEKAEFKGELKAEGGSMVVRAIHKTHNWLHSLQAEWARRDIPYQDEDGSN